MTSPTEFNPSAPGREAPTRGRALISPEYGYDRPTPAMVESIGVANRRRGRTGMITALLGLLVFGAASFWLFTPRGGSGGQAAETGATAAATAGAAAIEPSDGTSSAASAAASATSAAPSRSVAPVPPIAPGSAVAMPRGDLPGWHQTFAEDFTSDIHNRWFLYSGQPGGDPLGWWDPSHVSVSNGILTISGSRAPTPNGNLYVTGGLSNSKSFSQRYGRFAVRFRMDKGYGLAYAMLLWPKNNQWPPEIDILEDNAKNRDMTSATLHYGANNSMVHRETKGDFSVWHIAEVDWTPGKLVYRLDGKVWTTMTTSNVPSTPMTIALQSQAWPCGTWEGCPNSSTPGVVNFQVDWVVAYAQA